MGKKNGSPRLFTGISWGVTILIVAGLLGFGFLRVLSSLSVSAAPQSARQATPTGKSRAGAFSTRIAPANANANLDAIVRKKGVFFWDFPFFFSSPFFFSFL